jgi:DNA-binding MarR family transcriptional regulator
MIADGSPTAHPGADGGHPGAAVLSGHDAAQVIKGQAAVVDAVLAASRLFVAVASNALVGTTPQVTLPQFRALVLLEQHGALSVAHLAAELDVVASTASRMCDRLVNKKLVHRGVDRSNRRQVTLRLLPAGHTLIAESTRRRRQEISLLLRSISPADQDQLAASLDLLVTAATT